LRDSLGVLEDGIEGVEVDGAEAGEAGGDAEVVELLLGAFPPLRPVGGHDEDVVLQKCPRPGAAVRLLRHHRLAGDQLAAVRQRGVAVPEDGRALVVGPRRQNPLHDAQFWFFFGFWVFAMEDGLLGTVPS